MCSLPSRNRSPRRCGTASAARAVSPSRATTSFAPSPASRSSSYAARTEPCARSSTSAVTAARSCAPARRGASATSFSAPTMRGRTRLRARSSARPTCRTSPGSTRAPIHCTRPRSPSTRGSCSSASHRRRRRSWSGSRPWPIVCGGSLSPRSTSATRPNTTSPRTGSSSSRTTRSASIAPSSIPSWPRGCRTRAAPTTWWTVRSLADTCASRIRMRAPR